MFDRILADAPDAPVDRVATEARPALKRAVTVGWLLDDALDLPGTDRTFGVDALIGIVPIVGDLFAAGISWYIVLEAIRFRAPPRMVGRMLFNVGVDFLLGFLPVIGFFLDLLWPANEWNAELLTTHLMEEYRVAGDGSGEGHGDGPGGGQSESP